MIPVFLFWFGIALAALKLVGLVTCSWWVPVAATLSGFIIFNVANMVLCYHFTGDWKFWKY